jgi:predicted nucleic acid-binding Zn ribbon protein
MGQEIYPESLKTIIRRNIKRRKRETIIDWSLLALAALIIAYKCGVF